MDSEGEEKADLGKSNVPLALPIQSPLIWPSALKNTHEDRNETLKYSGRSLHIHPTLGQRGPQFATNHNGTALPSRS
ncbi:hypothetical protein PO909_033624 [Leuciscus waleckii]